MFTGGKDKVFIFHILQMMAGNMCVKATPRFNGSEAGLRIRSFRPCREVGDLD